MLGTSDKTESFSTPSGPAFERHYRPREITQLWGASVDTVRRIFENEEGVIKIGHSEGLHRRRYVSLLIPESVVRRVHRRLTQSPPAPKRGKLTQ